MDGQTTWAKTISAKTICLPTLKGGDITISVDISELTCSICNRQFRVKIDFFLFWFYGPSRLFHSFEPSQSLGGAKAGDPQEKPSDHPQAELGWSHM